MLHVWWYDSLEHALDLNKEFLLDGETTYRLPLFRNTSGCLTALTPSPLPEPPHQPPGYDRIHRGSLRRLKPLSIDIFTATQPDRAHPHTPPFTDWTALRTATIGSRAFDACLQTGAKRDREQTEARWFTSMNFRFKFKVRFFPLFYVAGVQRYDKSVVMKTHSVNKNIYYCDKQEIQSPFRCFIREFVWWTLGLIDSTHLHLQHSQERLWISHTVTFSVRLFSPFCLSETVKL